MTTQIRVFEDESYGYEYKIEPVCLGFKLYSSKPKFQAFTIQIFVKTIGKVPLETVTNSLRMQGEDLETYILGYNGAIFIGPDSSPDYEKFDPISDEFNIYTISSCTLEYVASVIHAQLSQHIQNECQDIEYCRVDIITKN